MNSEVALEQARKQGSVGIRPTTTTTMPSTTNSAAAPAGRSAASVSIGTKPSLIGVAPMRFLIMDAPRQTNLHVYIKEMRKHHVTDVVRVCEPTYRGTELSAAGIRLHEMEYADGTSPSNELILSWLTLVENTFYSSSSVGGSNKSTTVTADGGSSTASGTSSPAVCIAVHCVAGLGRAPVLVAIALIEFANMDPVEAVSFIRARRRGAINEKQLNYLQGYKKQYRRQHGAEASCCVIS